MRVLCQLNPLPLERSRGVAFSLFDGPRREGVGRVAASMRQSVRRAGVRPSSRAWDFLTVALSVAAADHACLRRTSPDGWTRDIQLEVAVVEPVFWGTQVPALESALRFLTGDLWRLEFKAGGVGPLRRLRRSRNRLVGDCVCLLSGGVDSLVGAIDAAAAGRRPVFVSQVAQGDKDRQRLFAAAVGEGSSHLQLTHGIKPPGEAERSQRARSIVFLAYGVLAASALGASRGGKSMDLLIPENGFISLNVPLTGLRVGSLSTRTTHPFFLHQIQAILDSAGFRIRLRNDYQFKTKGEMLTECEHQSLLQELVVHATSCSRFARFKYEHCGRCVPCLVRRAAFLRWRAQDTTEYRFEDLSISDGQHRHFDDVRSVAFASRRVEQVGAEVWAGDSLNSARLGKTAPYLAVAERGIGELSAFLRSARVF